MIENNYYIESIGQISNIKIYNQRFISNKSVPTYITKYHCQADNSLPSLTSQYIKIENLDPYFWHFY